MLHVYVSTCNINSLWPRTVHTQPQLQEKKKTVPTTFYFSSSSVLKKIILWHSALVPAIETLTTIQAAAAQHNTFFFVLEMLDRKTSGLASYVTRHKIKIKKQQFVTSKSLNNRLGLLLF